MDDVETIILSSARWSIMEMDSYTPGSEEVSHHSWYATIPVYESTHDADRVHKDDSQDDGIFSSDVFSTF